ncbi:MAG: hypothetical protein MMC33_004524 [Icmadophila ericetorum]|nr:hypothetical protein [Icmadophila ericetorum]
MFHPLSRSQRVRSRLFSNPPTPSPTPATRVARMQSRLPRFLQSYTTPLLDAPISHIISFLLLHEITAVVPLFGLAGFFHYSQWMPPFISEGKWVADGMEKFGNWFRKRGWPGEVGEDGKHLGKRGVWWGRSEGGVRIVVEFATAYAITKALLPLRLIFSVWATPWFARVAVIPATNMFRRMFKRNPKAKSKAGTEPIATPTGSIKTTKVGDVPHD